jgi:sporulation protein YlmC with PRC-barrel domain
MIHREQGVDTMDIPMDAEVNCVDGPCGHSVCVIIDPVKDQVTHFVVKQNYSPETQRLVPIDQIIESNPHLIRLCCTRNELDDMPPFVRTEFIPSPVSGVEVTPSMLWPYATPEFGYITIEHDRVPPHELAIHRGAHVEAKDGRVGKVDEFLVDPVSGDITHLVLREGHLWGQKDVIIPINQIDYLGKDNVQLKLDKVGVAELPAIPVSRRAG